MVMDVRKMSCFKDCQFDFVIEKSMLDAIITGQTNNYDSFHTLQEIHRVLAPTGTFISFSHATEAQRKKYYMMAPETLTWSFSKRQIAKPSLSLTFEDAAGKKKKDNEDNKKFMHFAYICKKVPQASKPTLPETNVSST